jgi:hypothetical protein
MEDSSPFDLATLRVDPERVRQPAKPKKWRRQFIRVPWQWVECLQETRRVSTYRLALLLLYEHWRTGGRAQFQPGGLCRSHTSRRGALKPASSAADQTPSW